MAAIGVIMAIVSLMLFLLSLILTPFMMAFFARKFKNMSPQQTEGVKIIEGEYRRIQ